MITPGRMLLTIPAAFGLLMGGLLAGSTRAVPFAGGAFDIDFVTIGNPGNPNDSGGWLHHGGVDYVYQMGTYEISVEMINIYNADTSSIAGPAITTDSAYGANRPAYDVSWNEAARFVNWLNRDGGFQEAYQFTTSGGNDNITPWVSGDVGYDASNPYRNTDARYFLPTEDEWYKAAFYDPNKNGGAGGYWKYATGSDSDPIGTSGGTTPGTAVYRDGVNPNPPAPAAITNAGGLSPYGTMAQSGNYFEWMESPGDGGQFSPTGAGNRQIRGGRWNDPHGAGELSSSFAVGDFIPSREDGRVGFRVAAAVAPALLGDFDNDEDVDGADFLIWQRDTSVGSLSDWGTNFGTAAAFSAAVGVPEPSSAVLFGISALLASFTRFSASSRRRPLNP